MTDALRIERIDANQVRVAGRLGFAEAAAALARSEAVIGAGAREVEVDVSALAAIDSATLAVLLAWAARARAGGVVLHFGAIPADLAALMHLCDTEPLLV